MSEVCGDTNIDKKTKVAEAVPARWAIACNKRDYILSPETSVKGTVAAANSNISTT